MKKNALIIIIIAIFVMLGGIYAFYITPPTLSEAPDETGHFSYIHYLQVENKLPVLNVTSFYESDQAFDYETQDFSEFKNKNIGDTLMDTGVNWIVQHPPFYYLVMALVLKVARLFSDNLVFCIYAVRAGTLMLGVLLLVFSNKLLNLLGAEKRFKLFFLSLLAFSPMLQYYFSVISNDSMLILVSTISLFYLVKYQKTNQFLDMALFAVFTSLIILTKYTGCLIVIPYGLYFIYVFIKAKPNKKAWLNLGVSALIALVLLVPHLTRNYQLYQTFLPTRNPIYQESFDYDFLSFIKIGYIAELYKHISYFVGWYHFVGAWKLVRFIYMLIFGAGVLAVSIWQNRQKRLKQNTIVLLVLGIAATLMFLLDAYYANKSTEPFSYGAIIIIAAMLYRFYTEGMHAALKAKTDKGDIILLFIGSVLVVFLGLMYTHYNLFNRSGLLIATHGRYYYSLVFPFTYLIARSYRPIFSDKKWAKAVLAAILVLYVFSDIYIMVYTTQIWH